jgi:muramidase (phage lysozyme)
MMIKILSTMVLVAGSFVTSSSVEAIRLDSRIDEKIYSDSSVEVGRVQASELSRSVKAFLDTLAASEGTSLKNSHCNSDYGYRSIVGCNNKKSNVFQSYSKHPELTKKVQKNLKSDAAGRYQILSKTWHWVAPKINITDFRPESQDRVAYWLIGYRGALNLVEKIEDNNYWYFMMALKKLNHEWASLPGAPYGQKTHSTKKLWKIYKKAYQLY